MEKLRIATSGNCSTLGSVDLRSAGAAALSGLVTATACAAEELDPSPASASTASTCLAGDIARALGGETDGVFTAERRFRAVL